MQVKLTTELLRRKDANEALYLKIQDETVHTWQVTSPSPTKIQTRDNRQLEQEFTGTCQLSLQSDRATMLVATRPPVIWHTCGSGIALGQTHR